MIICAVVTTETLTWAQVKHLKPSYSANLMTMGLTGSDPTQNPTSDKVSTEVSQDQYNYWNYSSNMKQNKVK